MKEAALGVGEDPYRQSPTCEGTQSPWLDVQQEATTALQRLQAIQGLAASMQLLFCHMCTPAASQQLLKEVLVQYTTPDGASHTEVLIPAAALATSHNERVTPVAGQGQPAAAAAAAVTFAASLETLQELAGQQAAVVCYLGAQGVQLVRGLQLSKRLSVGQLLRGVFSEEDSLFPEPLELSMQATTAASPASAGPAAGPQLLASLLGAAVGAVDWVALFQQQLVKEEAAAAAPMRTSAAAAVPHRVLPGEAASGEVEVKQEGKPAAAAAGAVAAAPGSQLAAPHAAAVEPAALFGAACAAGAPFSAPPAGLPRAFPGGREPGKRRAAPEEEEGAAAPAKRQKQSEQQASEGAAAAAPAAAAGASPAAAAPPAAKAATPPAAAGLTGAAGVTSCEEAAEGTIPRCKSDIRAEDVEALKGLTCGMADQTELGGSLGGSMAGSPVKPPLPASPVEAGAPHSPPARRAEAAACPTAAVMAAGVFGRGQGLMASVEGADVSLVAAVAGQEGPSEAAAMAAAMAAAAVAKWLPPGLMEGVGRQGPAAADGGAGGTEDAAAAAAAIVQFRGSVPSNCSLVFEKELQPNDVLKHNLVVPKQVVLQHWGLPKKEIELEVEDLTGNAYRWRLKPQPNGNRTKYVICGWGSFLHTWRLTKGSILQLYRTPGSSFLVTSIPPGRNQHALELSAST